MNPKIYASAIILAIVLVSACTIPGIGWPFGDGLPGISGYGLEITSFAFDSTTVRGGSSTYLIMEVENRGGTTVQNSESLVYLTGSNFDEWTGTKTYDHFGKTMKTEDVVKGIPADTKTFRWTLTAPNIPSGQTRTDTFIGRVYHEYKTSANGNVWVYNETEAEAARSTGKSLYRPSFTYTTGPVGLQISITPDPVILYSGETNFTLSININNRGSGTVYYPDSVTYTTGSENIALSTSQLNNVSVGVGGSTKLLIGNECKGTQELVGGSEATLVCEVKVNEKVSTFTSYALNVTVSYGYYTERTTTVTVQGK